MGRFNPEDFRVPTMTPLPSITANDECKGDVSEVAKIAGRYYRECSCVSCGAPNGFYAVSHEVFAAAKRKGRETRNLTTGELERHYGISDDEIDGIIYDDTRSCRDCRD